MPIPRCLSRLVFLALLLAPALPVAQASAWQPIGPFGGVVASLVADPSQSGVVYALAGNQGAFRSIDAGASWQPVFTGAVTGDLAVDPVQPSILYLSSPQGVWKSVDSGASWSPANRGLPPVFVLTVTLDPAAHNRLYAATTAGVFRSLDGGASWKPAGAGLPEGTSLNGVTAVRPAGTAFASTGSGLFRTTDGGNSWKQLTRGLPAGPINSLQPAPSDPRTLYTLVDGIGLFRTNDGGRLWQRVQLPSPGSLILALAADPRSPEVLYATVWGSGIFRSTDGARSWSALGSPGSYPRAIEPDPFTPGRLYLGLQGDLAGGIFRSDDDGVTWQRRSQGFSAIPVYSLSTVPDAPDQLWASNGILLFHSSNPGWSWRSMTTPLPVIEIEAASATTVFFLSTGLFPNINRTVWKTTNEGASWIPVLGPAAGSPQVILHRLAPSKSSAEPALYAFEQEKGPSTFSNNLLRSTDGGASWETRARGVLGCGIGDLAVAPSDASILYATGSVPTVPGSCSVERTGVLRSLDGGATWTDVSAGLPSGFVARAAVDPNDPDVVYAGSDYPGTGVWRSADGGATWRQAGGEIATQPITALIATAAPGRVYALVSYSRIFRSDDGGESWKDVSAGLLNRQAYDLKGDADRVYAATANGVWVLEEE